MAVKNFEKLEIGETYLDGTGKLIKIIGLSDALDIPYLSEGRSRYTADGTFEKGTGEGYRKYDLVEKVSGIEKIPSEYKSSTLEQNIERAQKFLTENITKENQHEFINITCVIGEMKGRLSAFQTIYKKDEE